MNALAKLLRRERKLLEELAKLRYEIRIGGFGGVRTAVPVRSRSKAKMVLCPSCHIETRASVKNCDWCDQPCPRKA